MTAPAEVDIGTLIERTPGVYGGRPVLKGTRTPVFLIAEVYAREQDANAVLRDLSHLDPALVMAGLAYYLANRELIDAEMDEEARLYDEEAARHSKKHPAA